MIIAEYDNNKYNFSDIILKLYNDYFNINLYSLDTLHYLFESNMIKKDIIDYYKQIPTFGVNDRSSDIIKIFYNFYDTHTLLSEKYIEYMNHIKCRFYPEEEFLVIQKTPNLRIHFPNCTNIGKLDTDPDDHIIGLHNDRMFGHPHTEINIIIALTSLYDTNSIYVEPDNDNEYNDFNDFKPLNLNNNNICLIQLNRLKHYNKINITGKTRVSFDTRIIPFSKYIDSELTTATTNTKFSIGHYYIKI
jgi:hypothetical protein